MSSTIILACRTIAHELTTALRTTAVSHPVFWVDSKLHNKPEKLREEIQSIIDRVSNVDTIILAFGLCGNGLVGLHSETARLILPRIEDCISLLLGSQERRTMITRETACYFLTKGWLDSENSIAGEYDYCLRRFGRYKGRKVMQMMLKGYRYFSFIETCGYDSGPYISRSEELARNLGLAHQIIEGSSRFFEKLLLGPWDDEFIIAPPSCTIEFDQFFTKVGNE